MLIDVAVLYNCFTESLTERCASRDLTQIAHLIFVVFGSEIWLF